jgi:large subunit ribosomal protein L30
MIAIIRISGQVNLNSEIREALQRLNLKTKYSCVLLNPTKENIGVIKFLENFVAYGEVEKEMIKKIIEKRGKSIEKGKKVVAEKIVEEIDKKSPEELGIRKVFNLHPPRGGIKSKLHYPKGVLGNHRKEINKLLEKML